MSQEIVDPRGNVLKRSKLKKYLEANGPCSVEQLLAIASLTVDGITPDRIMAELSEHPTLFQQQPDGLWAATPKSDAVYVKPATSKRPPPRVRQRAAPVPRKERREPPTEPIAIHAGVLTVITVTEDVTEIAGEIVATLELPPGRKQEFITAASEAKERESPVDVYQCSTDGEVAFRGARKLMSSRGTSRESLRIVVGRATNDEAFVRALPSAQRLELEAASLNELAVYEPESTVLRYLPAVPALVATASEGLPARSPAAPEVTTQVGQILKSMELGTADVSDLDDWLASNLARLDSSQRQRVGVRIARAKGLSQSDRFSRARELIDPETLPLDLCKPLLLALGDSFEESSDLAQWAYPLVSNALDGDTQDPRLLLCGARIAWQANDPKAALRYAKQAIQEGCELRSDDAVLIGDCAVFETDTAMLNEIWDLAVDRLSDIKPTKMPGQWIGALTYLEAQMTKMGDRDPERTAMVIDLYLARNQATTAFDLVERTVFDDEYRFEHRLAIVSLLEQCEIVRELQQTAELLDHLIEVEAGRVKPELIEQALEQRRVVEKLGGLESRPSPPIPRRDDSDGGTVQTDEPVRAEEPDLTGTTIVIVGGQKLGRLRIKDRLKLLGAKVKEIPPSYETHLDTSQIRQTCVGASLVVEMTREMKHDSTFALNTIDDISDRRLKVWGGPSAVIREVINHYQTAA